MARVGTLDAYWEANDDLVSVTPQLNLYDADWPIWTHQEQLPPAKFVLDDNDRRGQALDSSVSGGCIISGATVYDATTLRCYDATTLRCYDAATLRRYDYKSL